MKDYEINSGPRKNYQNLPSKMGIGLSLLAWMSVFGLNGCLTEILDSSKDTPNNGIEFTGLPSNLAATPSQPALVSCHIESKTGLDSLIVEGFTATGELHTRSVLKMGGQTSYDLRNYSFSVSSTNCNGTYTLNLNAMAGANVKATGLTISVSGAKACDAVVTPVTDPVTVHANLVLGAQKNPTVGSSIDLDAPSVMLAADAVANASKIDLVYLTTDAEKLASPAWAKDNVTFMKNWSVYNSTQFHRLSPATDFSQIKSKKQLNAYWNQASAVTTSLSVKLGDMFIVKTEKNGYRLIEITSQTKGSEGTIQFKLIE